LPQSKLCNYSSANLSGSLVGEAKGLALHLSDDTGLTELLLSKKQNNYKSNLPRKHQEHGETKYFNHELTRIRTTA